VLNPYATFDCLSIGAKLQASLGNVAPTELQLFAYLSCLLSLYRQRPVAEWGYSFAGTEYGAPFSPEINSAITQLIIEGLLFEEDCYLKVTDEGQKEYRILLSLSQNAQREVFLEGACSSLLALPISIVREALHSEPGLRSALKLNSTRMLLSEGNPEMRMLYKQFETLGQAIGMKVDNLMIPSVVWLTYLSQFRTTADIQENLPCQK